VTAQKGFDNIFNNLDASYTSNTTRNIKKLERDEENKRHHASYADYFVTRRNGCPKAIGQLKEGGGGPLYFEMDALKLRHFTVRMRCDDLPKFYEMVSLLYNDQRNIFITGIGELLW